MKTIALIVAGGTGTRFGSAVPKQFLILGGKPVLMRSIETFANALQGSDHEIVVTLPQQQIRRWNVLCIEHEFNVAHRVVPGGDTRWQSVKNALDTLDDTNHVGVIAVHDGVRPLASRQLIARVLQTARERGSAIPVVSLNDSVRQIGYNGTSVALDRSLLRAVQTPQAFDARWLLDAYSRPYQSSFTDDASVVEAAGHTVTMVVGEPNNLKITRPADLDLAQILLHNA